MTDKIWQNKKPNLAKLILYGFEKQDDEYLCHRTLLDGQMKLTVSVSQDGTLRTEMTDCATGEAYILHRVPEATGAFVGQVRTEYEAVLEEIVANCFDTEIFKSKQAKQVIEYIRKTYGDELEFLWQKFPNSAVVRRQDNQKWYVAILTVSRRKLGFDSDENAEIIDLRANPEEMTAIVDCINYLPGYHMNKKHWFTICLDGSVSTDEICQRIDKSYALAK